MSQDASTGLAAQVQQAFEEKQALRIVGGNSKLSLGRAVAGEPLEMGKHTGIVEYQPTELVITARAGTPLAEIEAALAERGQMLPFEPPYLGESATLGGTMACGVSGPRRPFVGSARDFTLGARIINGRGEVLGFGGQVMKNVAGYDVSRLQVGAQGTLGVLLEVSLKVLPRPVCERTLMVEMDAATAIDMMTQLTNAALPLSAACHLPATAQQPAQLVLRLSGAQEAVDAAMASIQKELLDFSVAEKQNDEAEIFWQDLRERRLLFFDEADALWRLSVPPAMPVFDEALPGDCLLDWAGAQRWLKTTANIDTVQTAAQKMGGHAMLFNQQGATASPLSPVLEKIHRQIKHSFDPAGILNPGRLYEGL
jgi:glycolate oxidase FAD binding subunit